MKLLRELAGASIGPILLAPITAVAVAASLFSAVKYVEVRSERNAARAVAQTLTIWADRACEVVGVAFRPTGAKRAGQWGGACLDGIRAMKNQRDELREKSAQAALDAIEEQQRKMAADQARARKDEAARRKARRTMEAQDARITNDDVGPEWFAALNELGGLLRPTRDAPAEAYGDRPAGEGDPAG